MLRIGTVPFFVARPLGWGLDARSDVALTVAQPAELARGLQAGTLDIALASSVIALDDEQLEFWYEGPVIASHGPVRSVLVLRRPGRAPAEVRRLALDPASRSGRALAQAMLREDPGIEPECIELPPEDALADPTIDAVQVIGDRAVRLAGEHADWEVVDLGETWTRLTGLPMVFAGWIARAGFSAREAAHVLHEAAVAGMDRREEFVSEGMRRLGRDAAFVRRYLFDDLAYTLPPQEVRAALSAFSERVFRPVR